MSNDPNSREMIDVMKRQDEQLAQQEARANANRPVETLSDGPLSVSIFRNEGKNGPFYSAVPRKIYTDDQGQIQESKSFMRSEMLRMANLNTQAYEAMSQWQQQDKQQAQPPQQPNQEPQRPTQLEPQRPEQSEPQRPSRTSPGLERHR